MWYLIYAVVPSGDAGEVIWFIVEKDKYKEVSQIIFHDMDLNQEGNSVLFVEPLSEVHGLENQLPSE